MTDVVLRDGTRFRDGFMVEAGPEATAQMRLAAEADGGHRFLEFDDITPSGPVHYDAASLGEIERTCRLAWLEIDEMSARAAGYFDDAVMLQSARAALAADPEPPDCTWRDRGCEATP
jgi:hypothetical protein